MNKNIFKNLLTKDVASGYDFIMLNLLVQIQFQTKYNFLINEDFMLSTTATIQMKNASRLNWSVAAVRPMNGLNGSTLGYWNATIHSDSNIITSESFCGEDFRIQKRLYKS